MSTGGVIAIVVGAVVVLFLAVNRGLVNSGVQISPTGVQKGIVAPQPAQNYGGYLAATTAPAVSGLLGSLISAGNNAFGAWMKPSVATAPAPAQGASAKSPSLNAQPSGPATLTPADISGGWMVGPSVDPSMTYNNTSGAAFDYGGLAYDNGYDPNASLEFTV